MLNIVEFKPTTSTSRRWNTTKSETGESCLDFTEASAENTISEETINAKEWLEFCDLVSKWKRETRFMSFEADMIASRAYLKIIGLGKQKAVPFLLRQLESEKDKPNHWFTALEVLTGADPVPVEEQGNMREMSRIWLNWARGRYEW